MRVKWCSQDASSRSASLKYVRFSLNFLKHWAIQMTLLMIRVINSNTRRVHECLETWCWGLSAPFRDTLSKVTFGIWVVTHSSAGERLGYMLPWKCTSCVITLYSRLNGVHPIPYLVNMSHLICACARVCARLGRVGFAWERGVTLRMRTQYCMSMSAPRATATRGSRVCMWKYIYYYPSHTSGLCVRGAMITGNTSCFRRQQISDDSEAQRK